MRGGASGSRAYSSIRRSLTSDFCISRVRSVLLEGRFDHVLTHLLHARGGECRYVLHFSRKQLTRNAPNLQSFTSKSLQKHDKDQTLNQRVQGSNPCTPTNQNRYLADL